jgi:hypothetical protein
MLPTAAQGATATIHDVKRSIGPVETSGAVPWMGEALAGFAAERFTICTTPCHVVLPQTTSRAVFPFDVRVDIPCRKKVVSRSLLAVVPRVVFLTTVSGT